MVLAFTPHSLTGQMTQHSPSVWTMTSSTQYLSSPPMWQSHSDPLRYTYGAQTCDAVSLAVSGLLLVSGDITVPSAEYDTPSPPASGLGLQAKPTDPNSQFCGPAKRAQPEVRRHIATTRIARNWFVTFMTASVIPWSGLINHRNLFGTKCAKRLWWGVCLHC